MSRNAAALMAIALILSACAPAPTREAPAEPPAGVSGSEQSKAEEPAAEESASGSESATANESSEPIESSQPAAPEPSEPPEPEAQPAPAPEPEPEPAPALPVVEKELDLSGRMTLNGGDADPEEAVVYFIPDDAGLLADTAADKAGSPETQEIVTRDKSLSPTVLAVSSGSEVRFPNDDPILHNLFSVSQENGFDLGVYGPGEAPSVTLEQPGVVNIYCNVHHDMHAHVLVVDTPWRTRPDAEGNFRLTGLPAGPGTLHIWHRQSEPWSRPIELPATALLEATLEVTRPRLPPHRDKTGQSYNRRDRDPYR